ncbi:PH domain-containing protein [Candidatus Xianfuyuplasma coldseepsis]|uniref:PH domain-containing protein n=1 Tax=Candidatus Xianfuyuplasma coldseepsis TaxID=2782163 RepID=A0A7L7KSS6_9MOLU|nr:PH domain-containing protein [Xianfuyuplasma coldseepsis]QMS85655.1 PH domain-containing protein [Xianfuyuplasma coldseepsis]
MRYKHKVDWWIRLILIAVVFMYVPIFFVVPADEYLFLIISILVTSLIIFPFFIGYIELGDDELIIKMHIFRQRIPYDSIRSIRLCTNFLSSMAMTAKRIEIKEYNKGYIRGTTYIGPVDREAFFDELKQRCYNLEQ